MHIKRCFSFASFAILILLVFTLSGCNSGSHPTGIGSAAPDFTVKDGNRTVALHDFKGQVVLLNFWATWCPPCVEEMPSLLQLQKDLKGRVTVLAVSVDVDANGYHNFIRDHHVDLLTVRDSDQKSNTLYGTYKFPETYVIDREGKIRRKYIGAQDWTSPEIEKYLASL